MHVTPRSTASGLKLCFTSHKHLVSPGLAVGIHGLLAEDLQSARRSVYMSDSAQNTLKNSKQRHAQTP